MIYASSQQIPFHPPSLNIGVLINVTPHLNFTLLHLGFVFCLLGYGTKAGYLPHAQLAARRTLRAPVLASAILSGALLNCALYGIFRISHIVLASQKGHHALAIVTVMGAVTALAGSLFLIRQHSFKRIWAYSSIENVGILLTTIGLVSGPRFSSNPEPQPLQGFSLPHVRQHSGSLRHQALERYSRAFRCATNLARYFDLGRTSCNRHAAVRHVLERTADSSDDSYSEKIAIAVMLVLALTISFVAIFAHVGRIVCGGVKPSFAAYRPLASSIMPTLLILCSLALGLATPPQFWSFISQNADLNQNVVILARVAFLTDAQQLRGRK